MQCADSRIAQSEVCGDEAKTGFALTRLQRPVFYRRPPFYILLHILCFASVFPFFGRLSVARFLAQVNGRKIAAYNFYSPYLKQLPFGAVFCFIRII